MKAVSEPLVSVITPVYNTEKYIEECIESILRQTYQNWEYIIVNNCSTDRTRQIAESYVHKDKRIQVYNNSEFLDIMPNWNHSVQLISAKSKYCKIVHADDWLFPDCIGKMVETAEKNPTVGVVGAYRLDEEAVNLDGLPYPSEVTSGRKICRWNLLGGPYLFGSPTSTLIRSDCIRNREPFYNESNIHADKEVCFEILMEADFGFVHQILTFTRRHNDSQSTQIMRFNTQMMGKLAILKKYGPFFLSDDEYQNRMRTVVKNYHGFIARTLLDPKKMKLYGFHRQELAKHGIQINTFQLLKALTLEFLNLTDTIRRLKKGLEEDPDSGFQDHFRGER